MRNPITPPPPAIVIDAEKLSQIAIIQDLGRRGIPITAIAADEAAPGLRSRYVQRKIISPLPSHNAAYAEFLAAEAPRGVLFYSNDASAEMVASHRECLRRAGFSFLTSSPATLASVVRKSQLYTTAAACGIKVPRSRLVSAQSAAAAAAEIGFPCILKSTNLAGGVYERIARPENVPDALARMQAVISGDHWRHRHAELMVQEWIRQEHTTLWNFNALVYEGRIVSFSMGRRVRTDLRSDGTVGSMLLYGVTAFNGPVFEANRRLLAHLVYTGIAETEWSLTADDPEQLYLYDFNPRPSGNFRWTLKSGVPMAKQYYELSLGRAPCGNSVMREGVFYVKFLMRHNDLLYAIRNSRLTTAQKARVFLQDAAALLRPSRHAVDILDPSDPGPTFAGIRELAAFCSTSLGRSFRNTLRDFRRPSPLVI